MGNHDRTFRLAWICLGAIVLISLMAAPRLAQRWADLGWKLGWWGPPLAFLAQVVGLAGGILLVMSLVGGILLAVGSLYDRTTRRTPRE